MTPTNSPSFLVAMDLSQKERERLSSITHLMATRERLARDFERLSSITHLMATNPTPWSGDDRVDFTVIDKETKTKFLVTVVRHPKIFEGGKMIPSDIKIIECRGYKCRLDGRDGQEHLVHCLSCCDDLKEAPADIKIIECRGYKCRLDGRDGERKLVHCTSCCGDLDINMFIMCVPVSTLLGLQIYHIFSFPI